MRYRGKGYTNAQLMEMQASIEADPKNLLPPGGLYKFTPYARKKIEEIGWAVTDNLSEARAARGDPVRCDGYSGRQSNRR